MLSETGREREGSLVSKLEPGVRDAAGAPRGVDSMALMSIAISLKRMADIMESMASDDKEGGR